MYKEDNHYKMGHLSPSQTCFQAHSHQTSRAAFPRITMQLWRESQFGRLRPTHPYYDMIKISPSVAAEGGGFSRRGKWNCHEKRQSKKKGGGKEEEREI